MALNDDNSATVFQIAIERAEKRGGREMAERIKAMISTAFDADASLSKITDAIQEMIDE